MVWMMSDKTAQPLGGDRARILEELAKRRTLAMRDIKALFPRKGADAVEKMVSRMKSDGQIDMTFDGMYSLRTTMVSQSESFERGRALMNVQNATPFTTSEETYE
jgi:hypothetical protein